MARLDVRSTLCAGDGASKLARPPLDVLTAELSSDFKRLRAVLAEEAAPRGLSHVDVSTPLLHSRASELCRVASSAYRVELILDSVRTALSTCARSLGDANAAFSEKLAAFKALLRDHSSESSPADELLSLLSTGVARRVYARTVHPF